jgi:hypothetical protein
VFVPNKTGCISDDWIYYQLFTHSLVITLKYSHYSTIPRLRQLQFTVAHALGFSVSTSRFPATDLDIQIITVLHSKYYTRRKSLSHTLSPLTATNFPLLLHFTCNSHCELTWALCCELVLRTVFSLSYEPWILHARERSVVYCCVIQCLQLRLATCGAERSETRGEENIAHCCCAIAFRGFCSSTVPAWGKYATTFWSLSSSEYKVTFN